MKNIITFVCILFLCWVVFSWGEVASKNLNPNPDYSQYNFFEIMWGE